jgi:hypothetical protein
LERSVKIRRLAQKGVYKMQPALYGFLYDYFNDASQLEGVLVINLARLGYVLATQIGQ